MVPSAELRVYQPLEAFPAAERARWERYILTGGMARSSLPRYRQLPAAPGLGLLVPAEDEGAYVKLLDGRYYVCPLRTRMRTLAAILAFAEAPPFEGADALLGRGLVKRARRELRRMRRRDPALVASLMQSPWHVPVRWFVLFDDEERRILEQDGRHRLSYLTTARRAMRRAERAVPVLRGTDLGQVAETIVELHQWLALFDPGALVELDYAGLCTFLSWDELDDDRSVRDVQEAIAALAAGDLGRPIELYQAVLGRWAEVRGREGLN
ncbi:MAG: hypothetical protein KatS3mg014_2604 [Actinomycetota bacterium]|nr:MAG: hypothetical protein KatS3mg014_2604 [Actinomycetota bacterium]